MVQDIHHFHELGHQVAGLVPAIRVFVDSRSYGGAAAWAHRQLHEVRSATSHLHNATTAVPPYGFNTWASQRETQLWQQAQDMVASAKAYVVAPFWTAFCLAFGRMGWCALLVLDWATPASAQPGGGGDEGPDLPQWLRTSAQVATHLREQGIHGPAMLGLLSSAIASREADDYAEFARPVLDILCLLTGIDAVETDPGVSQAGVGDWVEFTERHLLGAFLAEHHAPELAIHYLAMEEGARPEDPLPPGPRETAELASRRERYDRIRATPEFIRRLRELPPTVSSRGHRLHWTGEFVQGLHDFFHQGFYTGCTVELLRNCIVRRRFGEYEQGAAYYVREVESQAGTFVGRPDRCPEGLMRWVEHMEENLWHAYVLHGFDLRRVTEMPVTPASSSATNITGDEVSMAQRPNKRWLKGKAEGRRRGTRRAEHGSRGSVGSGPRRCTAETLSLADAATRARVRSARAEAEPRARPTPKAMPRRGRANPAPPADAAEPRRDDGPLTHDQALDTWMLTLGIRSVDESAGSGFLPQHVKDSIGDTFMDHNAVDRLTLALAIHRLAYYLMTAMGEAIQQAQRRTNETVEVELEPESDESLYMQAPSPWLRLLQNLQEDLENKPKDGSRGAAEWLLDWLNHRCTDSAGGYFLGHMRGNPEALTSLLVTFAGDQNSAEWGRCQDEDVRFGIAWAARLQEHLPAHPGSRQSHGLPPERAPVMLIPRMLPDDSDVETEHISIPGDSDQAIQDDYQEVANHRRDVARGSDEPVSDRAAKRRSLVVGLSASSGTWHATTHTLRLPLPAEGDLDIRLTVRCEPALPSHGPEPGRRLPQDTQLSADTTQPGATTLEAEDERVSPMVLLRLASAVPYDEENILREWGPEVLGLVQTQRALLGYSGAERGPVAGNVQDPGSATGESVQKGDASDHSGQRGEPGQSAE